MATLNIGDHIIEAQKRAIEKKEKFFLPVEEHIFLRPPDGFFRERDSQVSVLFDLPGKVRQPEFVGIVVRLTWARKGLTKAKKWRAV